MKIKSLLLIAAGGVLLVGAALPPVLHAQQAAAQEQADKPHHGFRRGPMAGRMLRQLDVTSEQKTALLAVLKNHQPTLEPLIDNLITERIALHNLEKAAPVDESAIRAQFARVSAIEGDLEVQKALLFHDLRAVATPEQLAKIDKFESRMEKQIVGVVAMINLWIANS